MKFAARGVSESPDHVNRLCLVCVRLLALCSWIATKTPRAFLPTSFKNLFAGNSFEDNPFFRGKKPEKCFWILKKLVLLEKPYHMKTMDSFLFMFSKTSLQKAFQVAFFIFANEMIANRSRFAMMSKGQNHIINYIISNYPRGK